MIERAEFHLSHCISCPEENLTALCLYFLPNRHHINLINEVKMAIICEKTILEERASQYRGFHCFMTMNVRITISVLK